MQTNIRKSRSCRNAVKRANDVIVAIAVPARAPCLTGNPRRDGSVLLFAPDHDFDYVAVLEGCPEMTL